MEEYFVHFQLLRVEDEQNTLQTPCKFKQNLVCNGNDARVQRRQLHRAPAPAPAQEPRVTVVAGPGHAPAPALAAT